MRFNRPTWIWLTITVLFMAFMFYKSAEPYQKQDIKPYLKQHMELSESKLPIIDFYYDGDHVTSKQPYDFIEFLIRKAGHVSEYALLTFLCIKTLHSLKRGLVHSVSYGAIVAFLYACTDEWHQSFVVGRTGHPIDVFGPDLFGIFLTAVILFLVFTLNIRRGKRTGR
jgi:VanZ family protein